MKPLRTLPARRKAAPVACALVTALAVSACGGSGDSEDSASGGDEFTGRGPITYVAGKNPSGYVQKMIDVWNKKHPKEKVTFVELPTDADAQRQQMIQNAETESDAYSVISVDVVWNAEFAANRWIEELPADEFPLEKMLDPVVETAKYRGKLYSVPMASDGGLLYYRTDLLKQAGIEEPPTTWKEMKDDCATIKKKVSEAKDMHCYAGQFEKYEGLTVNFAEAVHAAGGEIIDDSGKPNVDTPQARKGLDFLVESFQDGTIPKKAITYQEEDGRRAFQTGDLIFHRNWPYIYDLALADGSSKVAGKFDVAPLPGVDGPGTSSLGGHNLALSSHAKNKATALDFIKYFTNHASAKKRLDIASIAPPYADLYDDKAMVEQSPYLPELKASILNAKPRPRVVNYGEATMAMQEQAYAALRGNKSSGQALKDLQKSLEKITAGQ